MRFFTYLFLTLFFASSQSVAGEICNFDTSQFPEELRNPRFIEKISIEIDKTRKWNKQLISTVTSGEPYISEGAKKRFKAKVRVFYSFGTCNLTGKVRLSGDSKEHIRFIQGQFETSLDVKLSIGNIVSATRFKLFLPEQRHREHEVVGTQILHETGFIAPLTFLIPAEVNGNSYEVLFQEGFTKEMLERNFRRESAIYEGDESLLWTYHDFAPFQLENIALSRLVNTKWALKKAANSQVALAGYDILQRMYLDYTRNFPSSKLFLYGPDYYRGNQYALLMFAMTGAHGLRPHNRRFYYDFFTAKIEPVYYDGDLYMPTPGKSSIAEINSDISRVISVLAASELDDLISKVSALRTNKAAVKQIADKLRSTDDLAAKTWNEAVTGVLERLSIYKLFKAKHNPQLPKAVTLSKNLEDYAARLKASGLNAPVLLSLPSSSLDGNVDCLLLHGECNKNLIDKLEITEMISSLNNAGRRVFVVPADRSLSPNDNVSSQKLDQSGGYVIFSKGASVTQDSNARRLFFKRSKSSDWILIVDGDFDRWKIEISDLTEFHATSDWPNSVGLTGCLNFYRTKFSETSIVSTARSCEDSANIVRSEGYITSLYVSDASSDGLDMDFSAIKIGETKILGAGNDCIDVSMGEYDFSKLSVSQCGDKGLSIGEASKINVGTAIIDSANTGIAVKDQSISKIGLAYISRTKKCLDTYRKKQEFYLPSSDFGEVRCNRGQ